MIFQVNKNKSEIKELCQNIGINYKDNLFLKKCPYQEIEAKMRFLEDMNLPITIDGKLNEIFKMSSENLKVKYGFTTEELINKYIVKRIR